MFAYYWPSFLLRFLFVSVLQDDPKTIVVIRQVNYTLQKSSIRRDILKERIPHRR